MPVRGTNPAETVGGNVSTGSTARIVDPVSGTTMINPNSDLSITDYDENGSSIVAGYDVGFGD